MPRKLKDMPMLIAQGSSLDGQRWVVGNSLLLGRGEDCDIVIPSQQVSRHHARLSITGRGVILEDLGSKNGTHCNGVPVVEPQLLQEEDIIQIALAQQFVLVSSDATAPLEGKEKAMERIAGEEDAQRRLTVDKRSRRVLVNGKEIKPPLSVLQFNLLEALCQQTDQVTSRAEIITAVWGKEDSAGVSEQALDALIRRLRGRLAEVDPQHEYIITVRGHGIRLDNPHPIPAIIHNP